LLEYFPEIYRYNIGFILSGKSEMCLSIMLSSGRLSPQMGGGWADSVDKLRPAPADPPR